MSRPNSLFGSSPTNSVFPSQPSLTGANVPQDLVEKLTQLGISDRTARYALVKNNNNVDRAAEFVFSGKADRDEVSIPGSTSSERGAVDTKRRRDSDERPSMNFPGDTRFRSGRSLLARISGKDSVQVDGGIENVDTFGDRDLREIKERGTEVENDQGGGGRGRGRGRATMDNPSTPDSTRTPPIKPTSPQPFLLSSPTSSPRLATLSPGRSPEINSFITNTSRKAGSPLFMIPEHGGIDGQMEIEKRLEPELSELDLDECVGRHEETYRVDGTERDGGSITVCPIRGEGTETIEADETFGGPEIGASHATDHQHETSKAAKIHSGSKNSLFLTDTPTDSSAATPCRSASASSSPSPLHSSLFGDGDAEDEAEPKRTSLAIKGKEKVSAGIEIIKRLTTSRKGPKPPSYERRHSSSEAEIVGKPEDRDSNAHRRRGRSGSRVYFTDDVLTDSPTTASPPLETTNHNLPTSKSNHDSFNDNDQASDLILAAMDRSRRTSKDSSFVNTGPSGATGSALALLGRRAASIAHPTAAQAGASSMIHTSKPVGTQVPPPAITVSGVATPPTVNSPPATKAADISNMTFFGSRGRSSGERSSKGSKITTKSKTRSISPFFRTRRRSSATRQGRDSSPPVGALSDPGGESDADVKYRPRDSAFTRAKKGDASDDEDEDEDEDDAETETEYDDDALSREVVGEDGWVEDVFDEETEKNTEANAVYFEGDAGGLGGGGTNTGGDGASFADSFGEEVEQDVLGEGPNVIRPPEPLFTQPEALRRPPTPAADGPAAPKRRKSLRNDPLPLVISRPEFGRNRCTITLTHGDPEGALEQIGKRSRSYVVLSDLSEESGYAIEWAIGTVARDGDELFVTTVMETDSKVDPKNPGDIDRATKLRIQKERQTQALLLVKQVTGLLQRTRLNVSVTCQAIHSKNARHMMLDLIDYLEPTLVIVGSRGLGKLKGILLGSNSHYLVQKSSVPVMVARRRLSRPLRKTDPSLLRHAPRVSLASASIEKTASSKQEDDVIDAEDMDREENAKKEAAK